MVASLLILMLTLSACSNEEEGSNYLALDINPSIEFIVDDEGTIESFSLLNEDAEIVAADLDFVGMAYEDALDLYLESAVETGYLDVNSEDNAIFITADGEDETFKENVNTHVKTHLEQRGIGAALMEGGIDETYRELAEDHEIGVGRARLISRAAEIDGSFTFEEGLEMDMSDIMEILVLEHKDSVQAFRQNRQQTHEAMKTALQNEFSEEVETHREAVQNKNGPQVDIDAITENFTENRQQRLSDYESRRDQMKDQLQNPMS